MYPVHDPVPDQSNMQHMDEGAENWQEHDTHTGRLLPGSHEKDSSALFVFDRQPELLSCHCFRLDVCPGDCIRPVCPTPGIHCVRHDERQGDRYEMRAGFIRAALLRQHREQTSRVLTLWVSS